MSRLNEFQKNIVQELGFGALLDLTCSSDINDIFLWLAVQFNTTNNSIELRNGFKFKFTNSIVHTILGIPSDGLPIQTNPSKEILERIHNLVQSAAPSTELLLSLVGDDNTEETFSILFVLLSVSCLIAPNSKGYPTKKIYNLLANTQSVSNYNWCSFAMSYLAHQIKKVKPDLLQNNTVMPGGCKFILVIAHFEFLITSEFKIPINVKPRLPLWSTSLVKSFIALDSMHGEKVEFGRLPLKHISSTPFNDSVNDSALELPKVILQYIDSKFHSFKQNLDKTLLQAASQRFWETLVTNCIPTMRTYINDLNSSFSKICASPKYPNEQESKRLPASTSPAISGPQQIAELIVPKSVAHLDEAINSLLNSNEILQLKNNSNSSPPNLKDQSEAVFELFLQDFTDPKEMKESTNWGVLFPKSLPTFEDLFKIEKLPSDISIEQLNPWKCYKIISEAILAREICKINKERNG
ncbi:hypothetical protein ACQJBY_026200 [Aegilops geniculata]